jgi:putative hemolysin
LDPDGSNSTVGKLIILAVCLLASAFFSASEASLLSVGKIRVRNLADDNVKNAGTLAALLSKPEKMLSAILVGNNFVNIMSSAISTSLAIALWGDMGVGIATGATTLLILIIGEISPKSLAVKNSEKIALLVAKPILIVSAVLSPVVFVLNKVTSLIVRVVGGKNGADAPTFTEQELMTMVTVSHEEGVLKGEEKQMIHNVFEFGDGEIREIMTPRIHVVSVGLDDSFGDVHATFKENNYSRMPVTLPGTDEIVGVLNIKDVAFTDRKGDDFAVSDFMRPPHFVYEFNNMAKVFSEMRRERIPMSVVLDEYGVMVGVTTMEDFVEEIVGDINDEYDDETEALAKEVGENEYVVDGAIGIDNFNDIVGASIESDDFDSIGGFVLGKLDEFPEAGDTVVHGGIEFAVDSVKNNRIEALHVKLLPEESGGEMAGEAQGGGEAGAPGERAGAGADAGGANGANGVAKGSANGGAMNGANGIAKGSAKSSANGGANGANGAAKGSANGGANGANGAAKGSANGGANGANSAAKGSANGGANGITKGSANGALDGANGANGLNSANGTLGGVNGADGASKGSGSDSGPSPDAGGGAGA